MRAEGVPALSLLSTILERSVKLCVMEDNEAMIKICHSGKNPTVRYLNCTHKVGVSWLMEVFEIDGINIYKTDTKLQAADIGAKCITCIDTWRSNCVLINLCEPGVDATGQRALLSALRRETVDKLCAPEEHQRVKALERMEARVRAVPPVHAGGVSSPSSERRNGSRQTK
jgi:hypothetical protein